MEGPTSSTCISTTVRFSPSRVSNERCTRRPWAITRVPFVKDSATFSAASRQIEQRMNRVSPSRNSFACRSNTRGVDAMVKFATAAPDGVNRSSGSPVRLPTTVMIVSPAITASRYLQRYLACVGTNQFGAQHGLVQAQLAIKLLRGCGTCCEIHNGVDAF